MKTFREFLEEAYLYEMRKEDKVKGKKKTPLFITKTAKTIERAPEGSGKRWQRKDIVVKRGSAEATTGRFRQGAGAGGLMYGYKRHPHGGADDWTRAGSERGVKKVRGEKKPEIGHITPAEKVAATRINAEYLRRRR